MDPDDAPDVTRPRASAPLHSMDEKSTNAGTQRDGLVPFPPWISARYPVRAGVQGGGPDILKVGGIHGAYAKPGLFTRVGGSK